MNKPSSSKNIAVFTSHLQGEFTGEIANQIREHCSLRGHKFFGFCTGKEQQYNSHLGLDDLDCAIIMKDCVSYELAKELLDRKIATVSVAYDYFPLDIPIISSDNAKGMDLAFEYLMQQGHQLVAFAGDLRHFEVRKRYERFCELYDEYNLILDDDLLIPVSSNDIGGGIEAGEKFVARGCNSTAVICASGYITIGFAKCLSANGIEMSDQMEVLGYGSMPIVPVLAPNTSLIDQNVHLIAYKAVSTALDISNEKVTERENKIEPKLISRHQEVETDNNLVLATSVDLPEIFTPGYVSSIINNNFSWGEMIHESGFEKLMNISPIFEKFMELATFSKIVATDQGSDMVKLLKIFSLGKIEKVAPNEEDARCKIEEFPPARLLKNNVAAFDNQTHFYIRANDRVWGIITIFGRNQPGTRLSSYLYLCGLLSNAVKTMGISIEKKLLENMSRQYEKEDTKSLPETEQHSIDWTISLNETTWSQGALALLDLRSDIDVNIYKHMDIADRVHSEDAAALRSMIYNCVSDKTPFKTSCRMKNKNGKYTNIAIEGRHDDGNNDILRFLIWAQRDE